MAAGDSLQRITAELEKRTEPVVVAFVDLAGSSSLKNRPQQEWLPLICSFLLHVSQAVHENHGEVIKYIGDEVFAAFPSHDGIIATVSAEAFLWQCEETLKRKLPQLAAKYCFDFGQGAWVKPQGAPRDILGTCVDRCARIAKLARPHTALASHEYVRESRNPASWLLVGEFQLRGLPAAAQVYHLARFGDGLGVDVDEARAIAQDPREMHRTMAELRAQLGGVQAELDRCREEVARLRMIPR